MLLCAKYTSYHRRRSVAACFFVQSIRHIIDGGVLQPASLCKVYVISGQIAFVSIPSFNIFTETALNFLTFLQNCIFRDIYNKHIVIHKVML